MPVSNKRPPPILAKKSCVGLIVLKLAPTVNYWFKGKIDCDSAESLKKRTKQFFGYQISQLFIQLQANKVLIDLGGASRVQLHHVQITAHPLV